MKNSFNQNDRGLFALWIAYSLANDEVNSKLNYEKLSGKYEIEKKIIEDQFELARKILSSLKQEYIIIGEEHFLPPETFDKNEYYEFFDKKLKMLLITQLISSGETQRTILSEKDNMISIKMADYYSSELRCSKCGCSRWDTVSFIDNKIIVKSSEFNMRFDMESKSFKKVVEPIVPCSIKYDATELIANFKINKELTFVNFFDEELLGKKGHSEEFDINYLTGQYNTLLEYAKNDVGYVQTGNTSVVIYKHKTEDSILLFDSCFEYIEESDYCDVKEKEKLLEMAKDFEKVGSISCDMWRVMFSDTTISNLKQHPNDDFQKPVTVSMSQGEYILSIPIKTSRIFYGKIIKK